MSRSLNLTRADWLSAAALWAVNLAVFGAGAARLGFYYDDSTWIIEMRSMRLSTLWPFVVNYIPGRNLFPVWQYLLYRMAGDAATHLAALHIVQSLIDGLAAAIFFLLLRLLSLPAPAALISAALFSFWPIHGETHYWHTSLGANLLPALFVMLFAATSAVVLRRRASPSWWFWPLDMAVFFCALLTYDQGVLVLFGLVLLRVVVALRGGLPHKRTLLWAQLPYAAAALVWMNLRLAPASAPKLSTGAWSMLRANIPLTASDTFGHLWIMHVGPLWNRATAGDWLCAGLVALVAAFVAFWLSQPRFTSSAAAPPRYLLPLAIAFYAAAYLPIWVWQIAPRHHYLPSIGLFAGFAAVLGWALERLRSRAIHLALLLSTGGLICAFAAASRGESRFWEDAFTQKKQLFTELKPDLESRRVLALLDFPVRLGPAYFFVPQDASLGPQILFPSLGFDRTGDVSASVAPGGFFLGIRARFGGFESSRFYPADQVLVVAFGGWQDEALRYVKNPSLQPLYRIEASPIASHNGPFAVRRAEARREGDDLVLSLEVDSHLPSNRYLGAVLSQFWNGGFHRWGFREVEGSDFWLQPVLLSPVPGLRARLSETLRLRFPPSERVRIEFFAVGPDQGPVLLGDATMAVIP